jgi:hypothetical protein
MWRVTQAERINEEAKKKRRTEKCLKMKSLLSVQDFQRFPVRR